MSYILDALRRAEADRERERGQVPGLHTAPTASPAPTGPRPWGPWAGGGLLLLAGLGVGSWWAARSPEPAPPPPLPREAPAPALPPVVAATPVQLAPTPAAAPVPSPYLAPVPVPVPVAPVPATPAVRPLAATPVAPPAQTASAAPTTPTASAAPIPRLAELAESVRRELPKLAISGTVYADDPASRFVVINGDIQREGAQLAPDLVLEQIRPHELVLRFKGQRFRQPV